MVTMEDVIQYTDDLLDVSAMVGHERIAEVRRLLKLIETVPQRWLMEQQALAASDLYYIERLSLRKIADAHGLTAQAVALWLQIYGPRRYVYVRREVDKASFTARTRYVVDTIEVSTDTNRTLVGMVGVKRRPGTTAAAVALAAANERRVAPATMMLYDNETGVRSVDGEKLWNDLDPDNEKEPDEQ